MPLAPVYAGRMAGRPLVMVLTAALLTGGCGGDGDGKDTSQPPGTTTTGPVQTVTTVGTFDPARPETALVPIPGYKYVDLPADTLEQAKAEFAAQPELERYLEGLAGRSVTQDGDGKAVVIALGIDPRAAAVPGFRQGFLQGVKEGTRRSEDLTVAGEPAAVATDPDGTVYLIWIKGSLGLILTGQDRDEVEHIGAALVDAAKSLPLPTA